MAVLLVNLSECFNLFCGMFYFGHPGPNGVLTKHDKHVSFCALSV